jgi:hypothetical protein
LLLIPPTANVAFTPFVNMPTAPVVLFVRVTDAEPVGLLRGWLNVVAITSPVETLPVLVAGVTVVPRLTGADGCATNEIVEAGGVYVNGEDAGPCLSPPVVVPAVALTAYE